MALEHASHLNASSTTPESDDTSNGATPETPANMSTKTPARAGDPTRDLAPEILEWIYRQGWTRLRAVQERAALAISAAPTPDVILAAGTASGKTEAAVFPLFSKLFAARRSAEGHVSRDPSPGRAGGSDLEGRNGQHDEVRGRAEGFEILWISPLRALMNDMAPRLEDIAQAAFPVVKWHGEASQAAKRKALKEPEGVVMITPESLEALMMREGLHSRRLFGATTAIVIDEYHLFLDAPRGQQLASLMARIEAVSGRRIPRIALSATLADMAAVAEALRPEHGADVVVIEEKSDGRDLKLAIKGYVDPKGKGKTFGAALGIASDIHTRLRGRRNLIFAGSRGAVELYTTLFSRLADKHNVPNEFLAHHANLARGLREEAERRMKTGELPTSIVATSTLEVGIDIGTIESVAQIGPPHSVAAMRQRLGRSGRREGQSATLRVYLAEAAREADMHPVDRLRQNTLRAIAATGLLLKGWIEPAEPTRIDLSVLVQQILSLIVERHGIRPATLYRLLAESGPFRHIDKKLFAALLRSMARPLDDQPLGDQPPADPLIGSQPSLIEQDANGFLHLGELGERVTTERSFVAVFETPIEYEVDHQGKAIGRLPESDNPLALGQSLLLAGRSWKIVSISGRHVSVIPAKGGEPPRFSSAEGTIHDGIVAEMHRLARGDEIPTYLDDEARALLGEARETYARELFPGRPQGRAGRSKEETSGEGGREPARRSFMHGPDGLILVPWRGSRQLRRLALELKRRGIAAAVYGIAIETAERDMDLLEGLLDEIEAQPTPARDLAALAPEIAIGKYDALLSLELQQLNYAAQRLNAPL